MTRYALRLADGKVPVYQTGDNREIARFVAEGDRDDLGFRLQPRRAVPGFARSSQRCGPVWDVDRNVFACAILAPSAAGQPDSVPTAAGSPWPPRRLALGPRPEARPVAKTWRGPAPARDLAYRPDGKQLAVVYNSQSADLPHPGSGHW